MVSAFSPLSPTTLLEPPVALDPVPSAATAITHARRRLAPAPAFALVAAIIGLALFASALPSPLYGVYQVHWHFSTLVLTLVYAVYCFGVLTSLLVAGHLSDDLGRRPVLLGALAGLMVATVLFILAHSVAWLFVARGLQGLTTGVALGAAGAALLDLHPRRDGQHAGLVNGVVSAAAIGTGVLVSSILVQYAPDPRVTPFVVLLVLIAAALAATLVLPEPIASPGERVSLRPQRPQVPRAIRRPFALAALGVLASWSIGGLFLSLGPQLAAGLLHTTNHLAGGVAVLALTLPGALVQLGLQRLDGQRAASIGAAILAVGMALVVGSLSTGSAALFLAATAVTGAGFGLAFLGALRSLTAVIPAPHRAEVMSAFYVVAYLALSVPAIAAGLAVPHLGLEPTFRVFGLGVVVLAASVAVGAWRSGRDG